jgi:hypothetical protein
MSLFDYYRPKDAQRCPLCLRALEEWQGKDGPNGLLVWVEGTRFPVDQRADDDVRLEREALQRLRLPERFVIYSYDCPEHIVSADCSTLDGIWTTTSVRRSAGKRAK